MRQSSPANTESQGFPIYVNVSRLSDKTWNRKNPACDHRSSISQQPRSHLSRKSTVVSLSPTFQDLQIYCLSNQLAVTSAEGANHVSCVTQSKMPSQVPSLTDSQPALGCECHLSSILCSLFLVANSLLHCHPGSSYSSGKSPQLTLIIMTAFVACPELQAPWIVLGPLG